MLQHAQRESFILLAIQEDSTIIPEHFLVASIIETDTNEGNIERK